LKVCAAVGHQEWHELCCTVLYLYTGQVQRLLCQLSLYYAFKCKWTLLFWGRSL